MIQGLDILAYALAGVFVTVFFFTNSDLRTTILYRAIVFASMTFFFGFAGWALKKVSSGFLMKAGLIAGVIYFLLLFYLKEKSIAYILPLGILDGFTGAAYWAGYNLNQYILTHEGRRVQYFGWASAVVNSASALGPMMGGLVIMTVKSATLDVVYGYSTLFFLVAAIIAASIVVIGKLPAHGIPQFSYRHLWQNPRLKEWKIVLVQQGVLGLYDVAGTTVISVLLFLILQNEAKLGTMLAVSSAIATVLSLLSIRLLTKHKTWYWIGSIGSAFGIGCFGLLQNYLGMWIFITVTALCAPFLLNTLAAVYYDAMDRAQGAWRQKYHMMLERDVILGALRTISYIALYFFLGFGDQVTLAKTSLLILPLAPVLLGFLLFWYHRIPKVIIPL
jgi:MFS family permease